MSQKIILLLIISVFAFSCSDYNKVAKSTDYEYKYKKAVEYYQTGDYTHANTLFQDLVHIYRGTSRGDELYYYYAKSLFEQQDFVMAGYYFRNIVEQYPRSKHVEEAQFMIGYCYYKDSPNPKLDQELTNKAIDAFQLFKNVFPYSDRVEEANILIDELREKIAYKAYLNARIYFDMEYYKAAIVALSNCLSDFPSSKHREEMRYMLFKAKYVLAVNSVESKKRERLNDASDEYYNFIDEFPDSKYAREVKRDFRIISSQLGYEPEEEASL